MEKKQDSSKKLKGNVQSKSSLKRQVSRWAIKELELAYYSKYITNGFRTFVENELNKRKLMQFVPSHSCSIARVLREG